MSSPAHTKDPDPNQEDVFDLDVEQQPPDPEQAIRDAVASVEAIERDLPVRSDLDEDPEAPVLPPLEAARAEAADYRESYLRALADHENLRTRVEREREEMRRRAAREILRELLDVVDNLERARTATGSLEDLARGVEMIHRQFLDVLRRFGVESYAASGEPFDPELHEAVASVETPGVEVPTVLNELQRGYRFNGTVLRPAMVQVALPPVAPAAAGEESDGTGSASR